jgi:RNA ligase (TIGR02306 family)
MSERKMATIRRIDEIRPIQGADAIEAAVIGGWVVVIKKGEFRAGDLAVYLEIDSWVPHAVAPFLSKGQEPREYNGVKGERLRTVKLRGTTSQGLLLPINILDSIPSEEAGAWMSGDDVTEFLGIQKWEAPIPASLSGMVRGVFPSWGKKTDAERCQNLTTEISEAVKNDIKFEVTIKLDGTSMSAGVGPDGEFHVCSRNLSLKLDQVGNTYVDVAKKYDLENKMKSLGRPLMISGEIIGEGLQKNQEKIKGQDFFVFNIWDPIRAEYLSVEERMSIVKTLGLKHVPVVRNGVSLRDLGLLTVEEILKFAEGPSMNSPSREGLVFKSIDGSFWFKAISNAWLIKND